MNWNELKWMNEWMNWNGMNGMEWNGMEWNGMNEWMNEGRNEGWLRLFDILPDANLQQSSGARRMTTEWMNESNQWIHTKTQKDRLFGRSMQVGNDDLLRARNRYGYSICLEVNLQQSRGAQRFVQSRAHFVRPHLQNWSETVSCFTIFVWNGALATVSCTFCRPLSGSRRATAETLNRWNKDISIIMSTTSSCSDSRKCGKINIEDLKKLAWFILQRLLLLPSTFKFFPHVLVVNITSISWISDQTKVKSP